MHLLHMIFVFLRAVLRRKEPASRGRGGLETVRLRRCYGGPILRADITGNLTAPGGSRLRADYHGTAELQREYEDGLVDLEGFSHLWLIYVFHEAGEPCLTVKPFLDDVPHGVSWRGIVSGSTGVGLQRRQR